MRLTKSLLATETVSVFWDWLPWESVTVRVTATSPDCVKVWFTVPPVASVPPKLQLNVSPDCDAAWAVKVTWVPTKTVDGLQLKAAIGLTAALTVKSEALPLNETHELGTPFPSTSRACQW
jgi:hypothetical protein